MLISRVQNYNLTGSAMQGQNGASQNPIKIPQDLQSDSFSSSKTQNIAFKGLLGDFVKIVGGGVAVIIIGAVASPVVGAIALGAGAAKLLLDDDSSGGSNKSGSGSSSGSSDD